jgi:toxin-antitoxin system PIN domain toxin
VFVVDTNVLVYAADRDAPGHERCRERLLAWRAQAEPWYLTWSVVYEFLRVTTHLRIFRAPWAPSQSWSFLEAVLAAPSLALLTESERHASVLAGLIAEVPELTGNLVHDAHTAALMLEHGVRTIYTRDTDFHRFAGIKVRDPLRDE